MKSFSNWDLVWLNPTLRYTKYLPADLHTYREYGSYGRTLAACNSSIFCPDKLGLKRPRLVEILYRMVDFSPGWKRSILTSLFMAKSFDTSKKWSLNPVEWDIIQ